MGNHIGIWKVDFIKIGNTYYNYEGLGVIPRGLILFVKGVSSYAQQRV